MEDANDLGIRIEVTAALFCPTTLVPPCGRFRNNGINGKWSLGTEDSYTFHEVVIKGKCTWIFLENMFHWKYSTLFNKPSGSHASILVATTDIPWFIFARV